MSLESRRALGSRFELLDRLGSGAMGEVWRARDHAGEHVYAAKLLRRELTQDPAIVARFVQERAILLALVHPGIVRVHDLVVEGDDLAIVMDLVEGGSLGELLRARGPLAARDAVTVTVAVLDALAAAHAQHCLHRDVKPDNVLLTRPDGLEAASVRLTDFSIARLAQESTVQATGLLGTPAYMPPELFVHGTFSAASDVYATGVLLYELLAGRTPFSGEGTAHTLGFRHVTVDPPPLPVSAPLWSLLATMLSKDPTRRLSAAATAAALRDLSTEAVSGTPLPLQPDPIEWQSAERPAGLPGPVQVRALPADVDVGATNLNAAAAEVEMGPQPGSMAPLAPVVPVDDVTATRLGVRAPERQEPRLVPAVTAPPEERRRRWPWFAAALVLVAGGSTAAVLLSGSDEKEKDGSGADPTQVASSIVTTRQDDRGFATGLEVSRTAEYDPQTQEITLTMAYRSGDSPLRGPFLEVLPPVTEGGECPLPAWGAGTGVTRNVATSTGVSAPCAWSVPAELGADDEVTVAATLSLELDVDGGGAGELDAWLDQVATGTNGAIEATRSGSSYPAQRLQGIELQVPDLVRRASSGVPLLRVQVVPVWPGGPDPTTPIYDSFAVGEPTSLLEAVAGGYDGVRMEGCDALSISRNRRQVGLRSASAECYLEVQIGELDTSRNLTISGAGG